jgi:hypothetical protein
VPGSPCELSSLTLHIALDPAVNVSFRERMGDFNQLFHCVF